MGVFWTVLTSVFTFGALALLAFAVLQLLRAARTDSPQLGYRSGSR
jgi:hypothetical protein